MNFKVNEFTTIENFERQNEFKEIMKFGTPYDYQKFTGKLNNENVIGWICLADDNIYGMKPI